MNSESENVLFSIQSNLQDCLREVEKRTKQNHSTFQLDLSSATLHFIDEETRTIEL